MCVCVFVSSMCVFVSSVFVCVHVFVSSMCVFVSSLQGWRRWSSWTNLSQTNNLELDELAEQLKLYYFHTIMCYLWTIISTYMYILQMLLKMHSMSSTKSPLGSTCSFSA